MKVIVAGGRDYVATPQDIMWLSDQLVKLNCTEVVCGEARGADAFGKLIATKMNIPVASYPAEWDKYGKSAGFRRNVQMAEYADACILFPGGKGTSHMYEMATKHNLVVIKYQEGV
jgi:hypothetical protein